MKDKNGFELRVGYSIICNLGECRIVEKIDEGTPRFGATVKVVDQRGKTHTIALLLAGAEFLPPKSLSKDESDLSSKYGVR